MTIRMMVLVTNAEELLETFTHGRLRVSTVVRVMMTGVSLERVSSATMMTCVDYLNGGRTVMTRGRGGLNMIDRTTTSVAAVASVATIADVAVRLGITIGRLIVACIAMASATMSRVEIPMIR